MVSPNANNPLPENVFQAVKRILEHFDNSHDDANTIRKYLGITPELVPVDAGEAKKGNK